MLIEIFTAYIIFFNAFCVPVKDKFMLQLSLNNDLKIQQKYLVLIIKWAHLPLAEKNLCFGLEMIDHKASLGVQLVKNLSVMQGTWVRSLGWEDTVEKEKATHYGVLDQKVPWIV